VISSSSSSSSSISSVSDPRGYIFLRARAVTDEEGRIVIPTEAMRGVLIRMVHTLTKSVFFKLNYLTVVFLGWLIFFHDMRRTCN
jgi:hypothetical protein